MTAVRDPGTDARVRQAAAESAGRGWHVFPTRPDGKEPRAGLSWPAAATSDPGRLALARWRPGENYGVAAKPSGLVILDLDKPKPGYTLPPRWREWENEPGIKDGWDVLATLAERHADGLMPWTFTVRTPSGGAHLYYLAPGDRAIGNRPLGPMIDVRGGGAGDGGYTLGPGSVLGGREYQITDSQDPQRLPAWIAGLLDPPRQAGPRPPGPVLVGDGTYKRLLTLVRFVTEREPGDRNGPLYWASCRAGEMVAAGEISDETAEAALVQAALRAGLAGGEPEARRTIASGLRTGAA